MAEMTIKRFGVISVAKMYGLLMFIFGLIFGVIYGLFLILFGAAMSALRRRASTPPPVESATVVIGLGVMIGLPIFYGILGFIMGVIAALVYNMLAGIVGGVKFELEGVQQEYAAAATAASVGDRISILRSRLDGCKVVENLEVEVERILPAVWGWPMPAGRLFSFRLPHREIVFECASIDNREICCLRRSKRSSRRRL